MVNDNLPMKEFSPYIFMASTYKSSLLRLGKVVS